MVCNFLLLFWLFLGFASSASYISDSLFESHGSTGRSLLQNLKECPISFEFANYAIVTSKCKGPQYPEKKCCQAFVEFACPYSQYINDLTTACANSMFSYLHLNGRFPTGLFASECKGDKAGLECPDGSLSSKDQGISGVPPHLNPLACLIVLLFVALLFV